MAGLKSKGWSKNWSSAGKCNNSFLTLYYLYKTLINEMYVLAPVFNLFLKLSNQRPQVNVSRRLIEGSFFSLSPSVELREL